MSSLYEQIYARSINDPIGFWAEAAEEVHWYKKWEKVLDESNKPFYSWFTGAESTHVTTPSTGTSQADVVTSSR